MKKIIQLIFLFALLPSIVFAADYQYNKLSGFVGTLIEKSAIDCCIAGKEKTVKFSAVELHQPINVVSASSGIADENEISEQDVKIMQLVLKSSDLWKKYQLNKGEKVRIVCSLFHGSYRSSFYSCAL